MAIIIARYANYIFIKRKQIIMKRVGVVIGAGEYVDDPVVTTKVKIGG